VRLVIYDVVAEPQVKGERKRRRGHPDIVQEGENGTAGFGNDRHAAENTQRFSLSGIVYSKIVRGGKPRQTSVNPSEAIPD
jgi:hypothetical protein